MFQGLVGIPMGEISLAIVGGTFDTLTDHINLERIVYICLYEIYRIIIPKRCDFILAPDKGSVLNNQDINR